MNNIFLGSTFWMTAIILSVITHVIIKSLTSEIDFLVIIFSRFSFSLPLLLIIAFFLRKKKLFKINNHKIMLTRSFFGIITMIPVFLSLQLIPIALVTTLAQSSAIFVTILSPLFLGEKIGIVRSFAVILGLIGVFLMTNIINVIDGTNNLSALGLTLATFSAVSQAGLAITLRKLGKTEHPASTALIHNLITSAIISISILFFGSKFIGTSGQYGFDIFTNSHRLIIILILLGVLGSIVQLTMAASYKYAEATVLSTLRYLSIPLATILGYIIWNEIPNFQQLLGGLLIITSCLVITIREIKVK